MKIRRECGVRRLIERIEAKDFVKVIGAARVLVGVGRGFGGDHIDRGNMCSASTDEISGETVFVDASQIKYAPLAAAMQVYLDFLTVTSSTILHACLEQYTPISPKRIRKYLSSIVSLGLSISLWSSDVKQYQVSAVERRSGQAKKCGPT